MVFRNANFDLQDEAIRHLVFMQRYSDGEVRRLLAFLNKELYPALIAKVASTMAATTVKGVGRNVQSTQKLANLVKQISKITNTKMSDARARLVDSLTDFASSEAETVQAGLRNKLPAIIDVSQPPAALLKSIVTARPMRGQHIRDHFNTLSKSLQTKVVSAVNVGLAEGQSTDQITKAALRATNTSRNQVKTIVQTAVTHTSSHAREETYKANDDMVKGVRYLATLDSVTSIICGALDGQIFRVGSGPRPAMHPNCRSTTTPVLKSFEELGFKGLKDVPESTRAGLNGQVPAKTTYEDWLKRQSVADQNRILGKGKADLFRKGTPLKKFTSAGNKPFTLGQLRKRDGLKPLPKKPRVVPRKDGKTKPRKPKVVPRKTVPKEAPAIPVRGATVEPPISKTFLSAKGKPLPLEEQAAKLKEIYPALRINRLKGKNTTAIANIFTALEKFAGDVPKSAQQITNLNFPTLRKGNPARARFMTNTQTGLTDRIDLEFSSRYFGATKLAKTKEMLKHAVDTNFLASGTIQSVAHHELGHVYSFTMNRATRTQVKGWIRNNPPTQNQLSQYGLTNSEEGFAEAWGVLNTQGSKGNPWVEEYSKQLLKAHEDAVTGETFIPQFLKDLAK